MDILVFFLEIIMEDIKEPWKYRHGHWNDGPSITYKSWDNMKQRCLNPNAINYCRYGGKGVTVDERWLVFASFLEDMGERPGKEFVLDRIDPQHGYTKDKCQWITKKENALKAVQERVARKGD